MFGVGGFDSSWSLLMCLLTLSDMASQQWVKNQNGSSGWVFRDPILLCSLAPLPVDVVTGANRRLEATLA